MDEKNTVSFCGFVDNNFSAVSSKRFTVPDTIYGKPVTRIEEKAFMSCTQFQEIIIPETVTSIGRSAFFECTATPISNNPFLVIGEDCFAPPDNFLPYYPEFEQYAGRYRGEYYISMYGERGDWSGHVYKNGRLEFSTSTTHSETKLYGNGNFEINVQGWKIKGKITRQDGTVSGYIYDSGSGIEIGSIQGRKE